MDNGTDAKIVGLVIYLAGCVINQKDPEIAPLDEQELGEVYRFASRHMISAIVAEGLEKAGFRDKRSIAETGRALRRTMLFQKAWEEIASKFEAAGINYLPLKGMVLKQYYPRMELREMSDYDILIDPFRADDVKTIMESLGYSTIKFGVSNHDVYYKEPVLNFELHRELFNISVGNEVYEYFRNIDQFFQGDDCRHTLSAEDFYVYMVAHEYKHYSNSGTGLRSLLDTYVYLKQVSLNLDHLETLLRKLGLSEFEQQNRLLADHLFSNKQLSDSEKQMLQYVVSSGTYGTMNHRVDNSVKKLGGNKVRYILNRFFVPVSPNNKDYAAYAKQYPLFYKHKILLPLLPFYRLLNAFGSGRLSAEVKALKKVSKD